MAEMIFESSIVGTVCFVKEDDPAINLPRILVGASAMLRVDSLLKRKYCPSTNPMCDETW